MLVPQPGQGRHDIRREPAVPENVRSHTAQFKRLVRYLKGERPWVQVFKFGDTSSEVIFLSDSDWAGDKETRKSSSAGVPLVGRHLLKAYTRKTENHRQKQSRSRAVCSIFGLSEAKGVEVMMSDLGSVVRPALIIDAKATEHILHRHGIGKN